MRTSTAELSAASTEGINLRSRALDKLSFRELVDLFVDEESAVQDALRAAADDLAKGLEIIAGALVAGGRLFYVGAGTSGRLGVLDASEIPPTFGVSPELVQGIIAGGADALHRSVEGAEDQPAEGALAVQERGVSKQDVVCGLTASGRTSFVLAALDRAKEIGARTILLTCNPFAVNPGRLLDLRIVLPTGPEILTGSTRLKAGTATKVALNILSTGAMIRLGRVRGNQMIDLRISNSKLRERAVRILSELAKCSDEDAWQQLEKNNWDLRAVLDSRPGS
jgi:N-acetylmuramic acid 6-phosphate etherase